MSKGRKPLQLWRNDSPEPQDYNKHPDPLHAVDQYSGCADLQELIKDLTSCLKNWMRDQKVPFEAAVKALKTSWGQRGGSTAMFDNALGQAFLLSGYYRNFK